MADTLQSTTGGKRNNADDTYVFNAEGSEGVSLTSANASKQGNNQAPLVVPTLGTNPSGGKDSQPMVVDPVTSRPYSDRGPDNNLVVADTLTASDPQAGDALRTPIISPDVAAPLTAGSSPNSNSPGRHNEDDENLVYAGNGRGVSSKVAGALTEEPGRTGKDNAAPLVFDPAQITHPENRTRDLANAPTLTADNYAPTIAYHVRPESGSGTDLRADEVDVAYGLNAAADAKQSDRGTRVVQNTGIRRLTPLECERLQGFPDGYTAIDYPSLGKRASDSQRYRALGNSMAVPVMAWLGRRILFVDNIGETK